MADAALPRGSIKASPDDFVVEEVPLYPPSGEGEHLFVRFTKRGLTTEDVVRALARAVDANPRDAGVAGMKDKWAVTTQTISLQPSRDVGVDESARRLREAALDGVTVHEVARHGHKLKPGHLASNKFTITVRDVASDAVDSAAPATTSSARSRGSRATRRRRATLGSAACTGRRSNRPCSTPSSTRAWRTGRGRRRSWAIC